MSQRRDVRITSVEIVHPGQVSERKKQITFTWRYTDLLCMRCGENTVCKALGSAVDYGGGNRHKCRKCGFEFCGYTLDYEETLAKSQDTQRKIWEAWWDGS